MLQQIAEIGQAHDGSLGFAHSYIDSLKGAEIKAIKFQMHIADAESSSFEKFRINFSYEDKSRFDYWKRMEFSKDQWIGLKNHCEDLGFEFMVSPFSIQALNLIDELGVKRVKIGSGESRNLLMLDKIKLLNKDIILSTGLTSNSELENLVNYLDYKKLSILHCTTSYPSLKENFYLDRLSYLKNNYSNRYTIGFSDHSGKESTLAAAIALGAKILEYHVVFDKKSFGPDSTSSIEIRDVKKTSKNLKELHESLNNYKYNDSYSKENKIIFGKSISVNKNLKKGSVLEINDLESKKPANKGISASDYKLVLNKQLKKDIHKNEFLTTKHI
jgi:N-acetylneuraminate synthase|tara:strand:- start:2945 stop:3934 length:990 start_codon:yes stop_codon:yes gene_type:complete